jgi:hypothetical protein
LATNVVELEVEAADVRVALRPTYHEGLRGAMHVSLLACAELWFLFATIGWSAAGKSCVWCGWRFTGADTNSVVAALMLAPTVAIGFVARQGENDAARRVHSGSRTRLGLVAIILLFAALAVALRPTGVSAYRVLLAASVAASVISILNVTSAVLTAVYMQQIRAGKLGPSG